MDASKEVQAELEGIASGGMRKEVVRLACVIQDLAKSVSELVIATDEATEAMRVHTGNNEADVAMPVKVKGRKVVEKSGRVVKTASVP